MNCNLLYREPELVVGLGKSIIFVNPNDLQIFKEITLPDNLSTCGVKITDTIDINEQNEDQEHSIEQMSNSSLDKESLCIQNIALSNQRFLLAVTTTGQKALLMYSLRPEYGKLSSVSTLNRVSTALNFSQDDKLLLIADKTGDCYLYNCENLQATTVIKHLLGHMSIVYDVLWSSDCKYIITCDRDDKIRVTCYPETYDIQSYCLGHKEFVSSICWLDDNTLLSISGDQTMRLWNYINGKEIAKFDLPGAGLKVCTRQVDKDKYEVALLSWSIDDKTSIVILTLTKEELHNGDIIWRCTEPNVKEFEMFCNNLCFVNHCLYVIGVQNGQMKITTMIENLSDAKTVEKLQWCSMVTDYFSSYHCEPQEITNFFKKRYDNVHDYLERKKKRQEGI